MISNSLRGARFLSSLLPATLFALSWGLSPVASAAEPAPVAPLVADLGLPLPGLPDIGTLPCLIPLPLPGLCPLPLPPLPLPVVGTVVAGIVIQLPPLPPVELPTDLPELPPLPLPVHA